MAILPEPLAELLAWKSERDRERCRRNVAALLATGVRAPPPAAPGSEVQPAAGEDRATTRPQNWRHIATPEDLSEALDALAGAAFLALDTETTGLDPLLNTIRLLQLAAPGIPAYVIDLPAIPKADRVGLAAILASPIPKTFQNAKFDLAFLTRAGLPVGGPIFDTMLAAQLLLAGVRRESNLAAIAQMYLKRSLAKACQASDWKTPTLSPEQLEYAAQDALVLVDLRPILIERLRKAGLVEVAQLEFDCLPAIVELEASGFAIDLERWEGVASRLETAFKEAEELARAVLPPEVNLNSPSQVLKALRCLGIDLPDTREETLARLMQTHDAVRVLVNYRKAAKMVSSFVRAYPRHIHPLTGRIHATYVQIGAATGRMSCHSPNLQQVPHNPEIRACFIAPPGSAWVIADYSQIELRVMAQLSQDARMLEAFRSGQDLHRYTAALVAGVPLLEVTKEQRQAAKAVNFGLIYAMGAMGLRNYAKSHYGVSITLKEARTFRKAFFDAYPGVAAWHARMHGQRETRTLSGRYRRWTEDRPPITEILNAPVQGTAADILKRALVDLVPRLRKLGARIVAVVHDEVIVEVPEDRAAEAAGVVRETMEAAGARYLPDIPVVVEATIAQNWSEK